ncbi:hypothetical protein HDE_08380 [Halotydeus destructor]|nr:hypothetical protein HDE_08380 [Halotydeus destructor]
MRFLATFNPNLRQLRITFETNTLDQDYDHNKLVIGATTESTVSLNGFTFQIEPMLRLQPKSLRHLGGHVVDGCVVVSLIIAAESVHTIESVPQRVPLPLNTELLTDSMFCHNHGDHDHNVTFEQEEERCLNSSGQVLAFLQQCYAGTSILMESTDKRSNILVKIISLKTYHCSENAQEGSNNNGHVLACHLDEKLSLKYRILSWAEEADKLALKEARHSFEIEYMKLNCSCFAELAKTLVSSTSKDMSIRERFEGDFARAYLVAS